MMGQDLDPDLGRWDLHDLKVCTVTNAGCCSSVTRYETDTVIHSRVREGYNGALSGYVQNDEVIAQLYQEELSRVAHAESWGFDNPSRSCVVSQEWFRPEGQENHGEADDNPEESENLKEHGDMEDRNGASVESQGGNSLTRDMHLMDDDDDDDDDDCALDSVVGKRLNQMVSIPHVPKINGELPSEDEQTSDHERLLQRLQMYGLVENKVQGDGNCQFHSLSDQLYRSPDHHKFVREQVVHQLAYNREIYEGYVPMAYNDYLKKMRRNGEWGDHVTLQATADWLGVRIFVITSFKDTCYIEILPHVQKSDRLICLSFWAEVHYNSIYPEGELPVADSNKMKKNKKYLVF